MFKKILFVLSASFLFTLSVSSVMAACDNNPECGVPNERDYCDYNTEICRAKCCIPKTGGGTQTPPPGGGGGGGGGGQECTTTKDCPAGTHPDWNQVTLICVPWGGVCGNRVADNNGASERLYVSALAALERGKPDLLLILDNHCAGDFHRSEC